MTRPTPELAKAYAANRAVTRIDAAAASRIEELSLAAAALFGLANSQGPIPHDHQAIVMGHLDTLFEFTPAESTQASDMLFEATLNHAIHESDRPRILACAMELTRIAMNYRGHDWQDREIWAAGFELFEVESLWEASLAPVPVERTDPVYAGGIASMRYFGR
jgi:hypothetical protein